ncbi:MAG: hypothetical protein RSE46_26480 [Janthinobacterium sp.]
MMTSEAQSARQSGQKNAKEDGMIAFRLRLSFALHTSECCYFLFKARPRPATTQAALAAGRGIITP